MPELSNPEILRYSRHLVMPEIGIEGQLRLKAARILCVGAGGLGSPAALYLAAAGVGTIGIAEFDTLDLSNLQRQILYHTDQVENAKLDAAKQRLAALNPEVDIVPHPLRLSPDNIREVLANYDLVLDGSDNFATRYLVNDACVAAGKADVHASVLRFEGQISVFDATRGPCLRCLFPEPPPPGLVPSCSEGGVVGAVPGILGSLQALEAIKLILGVGDPLIGRLLLFDGLQGRFRELPVEKDPACPACGESAENYEVFSASWTANGNSPADAVPTLSPQQLAALQSEGNTLQLVDVRQPEEFDIVHVPGSVLIPLTELPVRFKELDPAQNTVVVCHHGGRSKQACQILQAEGFEQVVSLEGGLDAWAQQVDPTMPRY